MAKYKKPHPRIKMENGIWIVEYKRLWDSERNHENFNYFSEVISAICYVRNLNLKLIPDFNSFN